MRPTCLTSFLLFFALIFFGYAYLLGSATALAAGTGVVIFVFFRAWHFGNLMQTAARGAKVSREADRVYLRQGAETAVKVAAVLPNLDRAKVCIRDLPPEGTYATGGNTRLTDGTASYSLQVMMLGTTAFRGVELFLKDPFFAGRLILAKGMRGPELTTYPSGISVTLLDREYTQKMSALEQDRLAIVSGGDIRLFRPYRAGDSYRDIDWKLTAKYDDLIVREHMDATGSRPLIVIDLPEAGAEPPDVLKFTEAAAGALAIVNKNGGCPVAFISGGNLLGLDHSENESGMYEYLRSAGKVHRSVHQYRFRHLENIRSGAMLPADPENRFAGKLRDVLYGHISRYRLPYEEGMLQLIAADGALTDVVFVTDAAGDISHLTMAITEAKLQKKTVTVILPARPDDSVRQALQMAGADSAEAV